MKMPLNPFAPSRPISPGQFVGRHAEIRELEAALAHAKQCRPRHFLMTGNRGVGKTSFLDYIRRKANGTIDGVNFNFLVVDFAINKKTTRLDFARTLQAELNSILSTHDPFKEMLSKAWSFIKNVEAAGISYNGNDEKPENHRDMYLSVADSLSEIVRKVCSNEGGGVSADSSYDGVLILIDEVDQASPELDIGSFLKYMLERLNRKNCNQVVIGLAGLNLSTDVLVSSHPSSLRIFDELPLGNLTSEDVDELLSEAALQVANDGFVNFSITESARSSIFEFSNGHPQFVHQFGYSAFEASCRSYASGDFVVDEQHVLKGAFEDRGALDLIGDVYFRQEFSEFAEDKRALAILDCLSEDPRKGFTASDVRMQASLDVSTVMTFLNKLAKGGLVVGPDDFGFFRVRHPCFAYWLKAKRPKFL
jgi:AAA ATPase domain